MSPREVLGLGVQAWGVIAWQTGRVWILEAKVEGRDYVWLCP